MVSPVSREHQRRQPGVQFIWWFVCAVQPQEVLLDLVRPSCDRCTRVEWRPPCRILSYCSVAHVDYSMRYTEDVQPHYPIPSAWHSTAEIHTSHPPQIRENHDNKPLHRKRLRYEDTQHDELPLMAQTWWLWPLLLDVTFLPPLLQRDGGFQLDDAAGPRKIPSGTSVRGLASSAVRRAHLTVVYPSIFGCRS